MASTRGRMGRMVKEGGVGGPADAASRTDHNNLLRPAYRVTSGIFEPLGNRLGPGHALFDPSTVGFWRFVFVGLAAAYVIGFHVTAGRIKLGIGPK